MRQRRPENRIRPPAPNPATALRWNLYHQRRRVGEADRWAISHIVKLRPILAPILMALVAGCSTPQPQTKAAAVLTEQQAHSLAEKLATAKLWWLIGEAGISRSTPPRLANGEWFWRWRQGRGSGDMEVTVTFAADGSSPVVDHQFYGSAVYIRP